MHVDLYEAVSYGNWKLLIDRLPGARLRNDIEVGQHRCAIHRHVENTAARARKLNFRKFQGELIIAVRDRNVIAEVSVITLTSPAVQRWVWSTCDLIAGIDLLTAGGVLIRLPSRAIRSSIGLIAAAVAWPQVPVPLGPAVKGISTVYNCREFRRVRNGFPT
jgi:hypothetical protein